MVDLKKLDSAINNLEESSQKVLKLNEIAAELHQITTSSTESQESLARIATRLEGILQESIIVQKSSKEASGILREYCAERKTAEATFKSEVNTLLLETKNENHNLYRNFEKTILSKFEMFKSEVIIENRKGLDERLSNYERSLERLKLILIVMMTVTMGASLAALVINFV